MICYCLLNLFVPDLKSVRSCNNSHNAKKDPLHSIKCTYACSMKKKKDNNIMLHYCTIALYSSSDETILDSCIRKCLKTEGVQQENGRSTKSNAICLVQVTPFVHCRTWSIPGMYSVSLRWCFLNKYYIRWFRSSMMLRKNQTIALPLHFVIYILIRKIIDIPSCTS